MKYEYSNKMNLTEKEITEIIELTKSYGYKVDYNTIKLSHEDGSTIEINPYIVIYRRKGRRTTWDWSASQIKKNFKLSRNNL